MAEAKKNNKHYIDNKKFYTALLHHKKSIEEARAKGLEDPRIPPYIGE